MEVAILYLDDTATFNCVLYEFIAHLTFQMRKVLVTRNSNQTTSRCFPLGARTTGHENRWLHGLNTKNGGQGIYVV